MCMHEISFCLEYHQMSLPVNCFQLSNLKMTGSWPLAWVWHLLLAGDQGVMRTRLLMVYPSIYRVGQTKHQQTLYIC